MKSAEFIKSITDLMGATGETAEPTDDTMVFPLQQKMEIIKKIAGDDGADEVGGHTNVVEPTTDCIDPIEELKKNAGIGARVTIIKTKGDVNG